MYSRIRDLREDADLNQSEMAAILGMSQTGYSKYETGTNFRSVSLHSLKTGSSNPRLWISSFPI